MITEINAKLDAKRLGDIFKKDHYMPILAILVSSDKELAQKYLPSTQKQVYEIRDFVTYNELLNLTNVSSTQMSTLNITLSLLLLVKPENNTKEAKERYSGVGRGQMIMRINKLDGEFYQREMFELFIKNALHNYECVQAIQQAVEFFSKN